MEFFSNFFNEIVEKLVAVDTELLEKAVALISDAGRRGRKIILVGNGASASIASHVAVDLTKNSGILAVNFNDADLITCFANDYGYERWVEKAFEFYMNKDDVAVLISSSGRSMNIINAAIKAGEMGMSVITLSGFDPDNPLRKLGDINLWVDDKTYNVVETVHSTWLLAMVDKISMQKDCREAVAALPGKLASVTEEAISESRYTQQGNLLGCVKDYR